VANAIPFKKFQMDNVNGYPLVVIQLMLNGVTFGAEWNASCVWLPHQDVHSARIERIQYNFIRFTLRGLG
jgi:hypothetical protein